MTRVAEKKNIGCPGQEGGDAAAISLTALATVSPEAPESPETAKNHWVQLSFSGFPWFSLLKLPGVYRDSYRTNTICKFHYPNKTANNFKCVLLCCSQELVMEPRKWRLNMIEPQEKYGDCRPANDFFCIDCQPKTQCNRDEVPRHLHRRKHPGSSSVHISIDRSTHLPGCLSNLILSNRIESN